MIDANIPQLRKQLPVLFEFAEAQAAQIEAGELRSADELAARTRDFYSVERMMVIEPVARQPTQTRALRNMRIHPLSSPHSAGCHEFCTVRNTRSG